MRVLHFIGATIGGILAGGLCIGLIEWISTMFYPLPAGLSSDDYEGLAKFVNALPIGAFLFVLFAWAVGFCVAGYLARRLAPQRGATPGFIAVGVLFAGSITNLAMIPHPFWFWFAGIGVSLLFGLLGIVLASPATCTVSVTRRINAPLKNVFRTLATIEEFSKAIPGITNVEFLTDKHYGVGTRFRETRIMRGKETSAVLEVTELAENQHIRLVADEGGTVWDTIFRFQQHSEGVDVNLNMDARPNSFFARAINPMIIGMISKAVQQDLDSVKTYCESQT